jgi:hypothetical protein
MKFGKWTIWNAAEPRPWRGTSFVLAGPYRIAAPIFGDPILKFTEAIWQAFGKLRPGSTVMRILVIGGAFANVAAMVRACTRKILIAFPIWKDLFCRGTAIAGCCAIIG